MVGTRSKPAPTFIVDCHQCRAKVAAVQKGIVEQTGAWEEPYGYRVHLGTCPKCEEPLVGTSEQIKFRGYDGDENVWSDVVRVFPTPPKQFYSHRIPNALKKSLDQAERSMQAGAPDAACVMLGRALEALCRDALANDNGQSSEAASRRRSGRMMLGAGIQALKDAQIIDERLFNWSQQLRAFRNLAAHPADLTISYQDVEDLQAFVYAITEYVYDLADRYEEFQQRQARRGSSGR